MLPCPLRLPALVTPGQGRGNRNCPSFVGMVTLWTDQPGTCSDAGPHDPWQAQIARPIAGLRAARE